MGKLIVIEGTDGSGKKTQTQLLKNRLEKEGQKVATFSFPQYGKKSAMLVEEYLNGKFGKPGEVNPYVASMFYAVDRADLAKEIRNFLNDGYTVILDRYVDSNVGHQGGKIPDLKERAQFLDWLYDLEYRILGIPVPDLVVILHVPPEIGQELVSKKEARDYIKEGTHDGHESDLRHLTGAEGAYLWLAKTRSKDHKLIECVKNGRLMAPEETAEEVYKIVKPALE